VNETLINAALAFRDAGYCAIPAAVTGTKQPWPDGPAWERYKSELPDRSQVSAWFSNGRYDGFGLVCGAVSGGLEMLELEGRAIAEGIHAAYRDALAAHDLSELWQRISGGYAETTPSGGLHILYRVDGAPRPNTKLARTAAAEVLIETRGEGGFTIVAPSGGHTHPTGKPWQIARGGTATIATISEEERDALYAVASTLDRSPVRQVQIPRTAASDQDGTRPGDDYGAKVGWQDILAPHGWRPVRNLGDDAIGWCRPGKEGPFISATTRETGGLYVFSTSTPFDSETPYSKFAAYAVLNHGGDYAAAARQLRRDGYGAPREHDDDSISDLIAVTKEDERTKQDPGSFVVSSSFVPTADPAMYHGLLGEIVAAASPSTEADPVGIYASLLAGAGVAIGPSPHLQVGNTRHPLLIWPLLFGRTGSGRKGEATNTAEPFLHVAESAMADITVAGLSSGEGLIERIRDPSDDGKDPGVTDKRLLVVEAEFGSVMIRSRREGSTLAAVQRQAWDGRALSVLNRKMLKASASHVAVIGHITPQEFRLRLAEADLAGGTYNRYLPLFVERTKLLAIPAGTGFDVISELGGKLGLAIAEARKTTLITLDGEATALWVDELYPELGASDDDDQAWTECTRRAAPYCLRIAGLLAVLDGQRAVSKSCLAAAGALARYSAASARYVLEKQARDPRLDRIRRALTMAGDAGMTRTDISALFNRNLRKEILDALLDQLCADDEYEKTLIATGGRPAETYRRRNHQ
jgi:hypothetical protein